MTRNVKRKKPRSRYADQVYLDDRSWSEVGTSVGKLAALGTVSIIVLLGAALYKDADHGYTEHERRQLESLLPEPDTRDFGISYQGREALEEAAEPVRLIKTRPDPIVVEADPDATLAEEVTDHVMENLRRAESSGNPNAVSPRGAVGECQIMPDTAKDLGIDPRTKKNCKAARRYLKQMQARYNDLTLGLVAYNWGPGNTDRWLAKGGDWSKLPRETREYVSKVKVGTAVSGWQVAKR